MTGKGNSQRLCDTVFTQLHGHTHARQWLLIIEEARHHSVVNRLRSVFPDEATFHLCGKINKHNCQIWSSENPHVIHEHERGMPKVNVWCGLTKNSVIGLFFFIEATVTGHVYLDMLQNFFIDQFPPELIFQQDGAPPHYHRQVRDFLNANFPDMWFARGAPLAWPRRSPDLTPLDFFLGIGEECCLPRRQAYNFGGTEGTHHKCSSACDFTNATEHLAGG